MWFLLRVQAYRKCSSFCSLQQLKLDRVAVLFFFCMKAQSAFSPCLWEISYMVITGRIKGWSPHDEPYLHFDPFLLITVSSKPFKDVIKISITPRSDQEVPSMVRKSGLNKHDKCHFTLKKLDNVGPKLPPSISFCCFLISWTHSDTWVFTSVDLDEAEYPEMSFFSAVPL